MTQSNEGSRPERYGTDDIREAVANALRVGAEAGSGIGRRDRNISALLGAMATAIVLLAIICITLYETTRVQELQMQRLRERIILLETHHPYRDRTAQPPRPPDQQRDR